MLRIFDTPKYIEDNIKYGFRDPNTWRSDAALFVRWKHALEPDLKKREVKEILIKKCKKSVPMYVHDLQYNTINRIMDKNWNEEFVPIKVKSIQMTQGVIDWFINQNLKKNELKFLFALYMGYILNRCSKHESKIKYIYDNGTDKMFLRNNTSMPKNYSTFSMFNRMEELGYLQMYRECSTLLFIDNPELSIYTEIKDDKPKEYTYKFYCGSSNSKDMKYTFTTEDLYDFGDKFWKITQGFITCKRCGKVIEKVTNRKYCEECAKIENEHFVPKDKQIKKVICCNCGNEFETSSKNNKKEYRCPDCYKRYRRNKKTETMRQLRIKEKPFVVSTNSDFEKM